MIYLQTIHITIHFKLHQLLPVSLHSFLLCQTKKNVDL